MNIKTRSITLAATLTALCAATGLLPYVFFLPVTVAATTLSLGMAAFVGLAFGLISLLYSFTMTISPVGMAFVQAPYIAIAPRIVAAIGCYFMYRLMLKIIKPNNKPKKAAAVAIAGATGSILNTALVVGLFALILPNFAVGETTMLLYVPTMLISGVIELVCMAALTPGIALTLDKAVLKRDVKKPISAEASDVCVSHNQRTT